ncbi:MAG: hypothetical protein H0V28_08285 [Rubrobacteraceae bacterium]|nr:hypothetical protein [Rubrobacteraceae bacterium]
MPTIGPVEVLIFLLVGALLIFLAVRKRVSPLVLVLLVLVLLVIVPSPFVATGLAFFTGAILNVFAPA